MADFKTSTQLATWTMPSLAAYKERANKSQRIFKATIEKYSTKPAATEKETPINEKVPYKSQQEVLSLCVGQLY